MQTIASSRLPGWGATVLRAVVGLIFLAHGVRLQCRFAFLLSILLPGASPSGTGNEERPWGVHTQHAMWEPMKIHRLFIGRSQPRGLR